jgi:hypothetical protein
MTNRCVRPGAGTGLPHYRERTMNQIIYVVGAVVIVIALLSFVGLR